MNYIEIRAYLYLIENGVFIFVFLEKKSVFWTPGLLGARKFHLKPCMFTWAKIGSPFEFIILVVHSKVFSCHLTSTEFPITC